MKSAISRRLAVLEARKNNTARSVHIVIAADQDDAHRQMANLVAAGAVLGRDGFLCLTGKQSGC